MPAHQFVSAWVQLFFCFFFLSFFFDVEPCGRKKNLTKSTKLNFLAKLKAENQRVGLNLKTSGTISDRGLFQHT